MGPAEVRSLFSPVGDVLAPLRELPLARPALGGGGYLHTFFGRPVGEASSGLMSGMLASSEHLAGFTALTGTDQVSCF